ncbi:MAG: hypothetical protein AABW83_01220 [Nanoarchaeota archaeon]
MNKNNKNLITILVILLLIILVIAYIFINNTNKKDTISEDNKEVITVDSEGFGAVDTTDQIVSEIDDSINYFE